MGISTSPFVSPENSLPGDWIHYDQNKNEQKRSTASKSIEDKPGLLIFCVAQVMCKK